MSAYLSDTVGRTGRHADRRPLPRISMINLVHTQDFIHTQEKLVITYIIMIVQGSMKLDTWNNRLN